MTQSHEDAAKKAIARIDTADVHYTVLQNMGPVAIAEALLAVNDTLKDIAGYLDDTSWRRAQEEDE